MKARNLAVAGVTALAIVSGVVWWIDRAERDPRDRSRASEAAASPAPDETDTPTSARVGLGSAVAASPVAAAAPPVAPPSAEHPLPLAQAEGSSGGGGRDYVVGPVGDRVRKMNVDEATARRLAPILETAMSEYQTKMDKRIFFGPGGSQAHYRWAVDVRRKVMATAPATDWEALIHAFPELR